MTNPLLCALVLLAAFACGNDAAVRDAGAGDAAGDGGLSDSGVDANHAADAGHVSGCVPTAGSDVALTLVSDAFTFPVLLTSPASDARRFVVQKGGLIRIVQDNAVLETPFLDVSQQIVKGGERGLLGLAFHPSFASNGLFYVYYTRFDDGANTIAEFRVSEQDPNVADPASKRELLAIPDFAANHNGGMLAFGDDGMLYIGTGDGGGGGDPQNTAQDLASLLGKLLRIDVDAANESQAYGVPTDNPFLQPIGNITPRGEIVHLGLRNPWRFSFDRVTNELWIGDVGQDNFEEIDRAAAQARGVNFGWSEKEGYTCFGQEQCPGDFTDPVFVYEHPPGEFRSVTGGYVYRGTCFPDLQGRYFFADYITRQLWSMPVADDMPVVVEHALTTPLESIAAFGEDADGELYLIDHDSGAIYQVVVQ